MNGAESLIRTLIDAGVDVCFANPGTTEMPMVRAIDETTGMRAVLCLFEGVCTGAADGYARMAEKPGLTLLHLGPGFANGVAYLHDARRARSPIINLVGEHATWHLAADAPLTSDIESLARPVSAWVRRNRSAEELAGDVAEAIETASTKPGRITTLIVPHDCQLDAANGPVAVREIAPPPKVGEGAVNQAIEALRRDEPKVLFLGGYALGERGLKAAARVAAATGCKLMCETFPARWERGAGTPVVERLPYFPEAAIAAISIYRTVVLAGAKPPVAFFGYPGAPSFIISPETLSAVVAALLPENAVVMDESNTSMGPFLTMSQSAARHILLTQPGGAIGLGPPCATGAAIACPDRMVINPQADGSAMYTLQALWTQARERLNVKTIICNNRSYRILGIELMRAGAKEVGKQAQSLIGLTQPAIDWVSLAKGMGVPGARVETAEDLARELERALAEAGPQLIEAIL